MRCLKTFLNKALRYYLMKRWLFAVGLVILFYLIPLTISQVVIIVPVAPVPFALENSRLKFDFLLEDNQIKFLSVTKKDSGYIFNNNAGKLWEVRIRHISSHITQIITQNACTGTTGFDIVESGGDKTLTMIWNNCTIDPLNKFNLQLVVKAFQDNPISKWDFTIDSNLQNYGLERVSLFIGFAKDTSQDGFLVIPWHGWLIKNPQNKLVSLVGTDGGIWQHTQLFPYYVDSGNGIYVSTLDGTAAYAKNNLLRGYGNRYEHEIVYYPPNMLTPNLDYNTPYSTAIGVFQGDWYNAAQIYRSWMEGQPILSKGKLKNRNDIPLWFKELKLYNTGFLPNWPYLYPSIIDDLVDKYTNVKNYYEVDKMLMFFWDWNMGDFGYYTPINNLGLFFNLLKTNNIYPIVRILSFGVSSSAPNYATALPYALRDIGNNLLTYPGPGNIIFVDPSEDYFIDMYEDIVQNKLIPNNIKGFFYDNPYLGDNVCFDLSHGHSAGAGGNYLIDGIISHMGAIAQFGKSLDPEFIVVHETAFEGYIRGANAESPAYSLIRDIITIDESATFIPLFETIYHDYALLIGGNEKSDYLNSGLLDFEDLDVSAANGLSRGLMLGTSESALMQFYLSDPSKALPNYLVNTVSWGSYQSQADKVVNHTKYLKKLIKARNYGKEYLIYGQMLRPLQTSILNTQKTFVDIFAWIQYDATVPTVYNSVWKSSDNKIGLVFTNYNSNSKTFYFNFPLLTYGLSPTLDYGLYILNESGSHLIEGFNGNLNNYIVQMPPKAVRIYEIYEYLEPPPPPLPCSATYPGCSGACPSGQTCQQQGSSCVCATSPQSPIQPPSQTTPPTIVVPPVTQQPPQIQPPYLSEQQEVEEVQKKYGWRKYRFHITILIIIIIICIIVITKSFFKGGPRLQYGGK